MASKKPLRRVLGCEDRKNGNGQWIQSWMETTSSEHIQYRTFLGDTWQHLCLRTRPGSWNQKENPTYVGVVNGFRDFQSFSEWAVEQPGYAMNDWRGNKYHLDKDLIHLGSRMYSERTCAFVPQRLNGLLHLKTRKREGLPNGVYFCNRTKKFVAQMGLLGKNIFLGRYIDAMEAHREWQKMKIKIISDALNWYKDVDGFNERVADGLMGRVDSIKLHLANGMETEAL